MAQAARLNLRMQKELKLLLADPSHGASFPSLSPDSNDLSLSSIDAHIKGPEGTVYAEGIFNVKIQIPERYPFQPPIVTFAKPIYHPNIDNGGRICLDILNLPPKGAWQPSLNISTVLTSIGLLLSEPNPDDGLMCEASREYKYNRQAFDQKARSMTEKYAHPGASGNVGASGCIQTDSNPNMVEVKTVENESKPASNEYVLNCKKICGTGSKLTLQSSGPSEKRVESEEGNEASNNNLPVKYSKKQMNVEETKKELKHTIQESNWVQEKLNGNRRKLSLVSFAQSQKSNDTENEKDEIDRVGPRRASLFHVVPVIWHRPPPGCIKINTDGAARGRTGKASCGGVFRDCTGSILGAFSESCGHLTAIEAELQGVIRAVHIAWRGGLRRIWLECDSTQVVKLVNKLSLDAPSSVRDMWIITLGFLKQMEFYTVTHIYREGNAVADRLANYAFESASAFQFWGWNEPPEFVLKDAKIDASGLTRYRVK